MNNTINGISNRVVCSDSDSEWEDLPQPKHKDKNTGTAWRTASKTHTYQRATASGGRLRTTSPKGKAQAADAATPAHRHDMYEVRQNPGMRAWDMSSTQGGVYVGLDAPSTVRQCRTCGQYEGQILFQQGMEGVIDVVGGIVAGVKGLFTTPEKR